MLKRLSSLNPFSGRNRDGDDFDWSVYTAEYSRQIGEMSRRFDFLIPSGTARFDRATGKLVPGGARLHPNWHVIYEIAGALAVNSIHEVGCGGGYHLHNLSTLYPELKVSGGDRSTGQIDLLRRFAPAVADRVIVQDTTMPMSSQWPRADLIFTQAVLMHIQTGVSHLVALANIINLADRYVVLMENCSRHHFVDDVTRLADGGHLNWPRVNFHYYSFAGRPHCLVLAKEACDLPRLTDYSTLLA
jgi:SAM-dependent methyltransferase